jgi:hypothetical protein
MPQPKHEIIHLRDRYPGEEGVKDIDWIQALGSEGEWIIISGDLRITRNPIERAAWMESGLTGFFFGDAWASMAFWKLAADLIDWWPRIVDKAKHCPANHGFLINKGAKAMRQIYPE